MEKNKSKKRITTIITIIILALSINTKVKGAIAITEAGASVLTGKTISEFFDMAQQMKDPGQALEGTELDPHMATNKEWAAVSYLSNSNYGTGGAGQNNGMTVTINGNSHYSITDNITGVIDWGKTYSFTAGILSEADTNITDKTVRANGKSLIENIDNSSKVDQVDKVSLDEIAANRGWNNSVYYSQNYSDPYSVRIGLFSLMAGTFCGSNSAPWNTSRWSSRAWCEYYFPTSALIYIFVSMIFDRLFD